MKYSIIFRANSLAICVLHVLLCSHCVPRTIFSFYCTNNKCMVTWKFEKITYTNSFVTTDEFQYEWTHVSNVADYRLTIFFNSWPYRNKIRRKFTSRTCFKESYQKLKLPKAICKDNPEIKFYWSIVWSSHGATSSVK